MKLYVCECVSVCGCVCVCVVCVCAPVFVCDDTQHNGIQSNNKENGTLSIMVKCCFVVPVMLTLAYAEFIN